VELRGILLELTRLGHTILVSSHILAELEEICDRVGIIETGRVLAQGSSDELRRTVAAATSVSLRVLGGEDAQARAVEVATRAGAVQAPGRTGILRFEVAGGDEAAAALLAALVTAGVRVVDFREEAGGLERLFLTLTQGVRR
jgi:ABC-2 type transport system ATP-binding protein